MKSYKGLLLAGAMITFTAHAIELGQYLTGNYVDEKGRTFLHKLAHHSCRKKFTLQLDLFDFVENKIPVEKPKLENCINEMRFLYNLSPEFAFLVVLAEAVQFVNLKDNNGDTALDLARKSRDESILGGDVPHERNQLLIDALSNFEAKKDEDNVILGGDCGNTGKCCCEEE